MMELTNMKGWTPWEGLGLVILILLIAVLCSRKANGQCATRERRTTIYLSYYPADNGVGLRFDYPVLPVIMIYNSASYGTTGLYREYNLKNHFKLTTGVLIPLKPYNDDKCYISAGVNYHHVEKAGGTGVEVKPLILRPWSFELGVTAKLRKLAIGLRTDILRWEPSVDVGIFF